MEMLTSSTPSPVKLTLLLKLSPAAASTVISKGAGGKRRVQLDGGGAYECRTCGRRFATFQALGGHRTSHKRPRVRARGLDLLLGSRPGEGAARPVHRCGTCGEVFTTGQALGGHMRRHSRPAVEAAVGAATWTEATPSSSSSSSGLSAQRDDEENDAWPTLIQFL